MLVLHGKYFLGRRVVGFRNDFCIACNTPRLAYQHRTFDLLHIFFIPLLPLGFWRRWHCSVCGNDPHANVRTRTSFKWVGTILLGLIAVLFWTVPIDQEMSGEDAIYFQVIKYGAPVVFAIALFLTIRGKRAPNLKEKLLMIQPAHDTTCPLCGTMLAPRDDSWQCLECGIRRMALPPR